jgi:fibronectin-binding autotransporter adhesin
MRFIQPRPDATSVSTRNTRSSRRGRRDRRLFVEPLEVRQLLAVLRVDADAVPGGDGQAWETAFHDLQDALTMAAARNADVEPENDVDAIWIAEGTYRPSIRLQSDDPRSATFMLEDGVALIGGFAGHEQHLEDRDSRAHRTKISGDIGVLDDRADNSYTVVYCAAGIQASIDGILILRGRADGSIDSSHPERYQGAGIYLEENSVLKIVNTTLSENTVVGGDNGSGGAVFNGGALTVSLSVLSENVVDGEVSYGGAIYNQGQLTISKSELNSNRVIGEHSFGGAIFNAPQAELAVLDSQINDNVARSNYSTGGGIHNSGVLLIADSIFNNNFVWASSGWGGGVWNEGSLTLARSVLEGNWLLGNSGGGGGIYNSGVLDAYNSVLVGNALSGTQLQGGALLTSSESTSSLVNVTVTGNWMRGKLDSGGGIHSAGQLLLANSIVYANSGGDIQGHFTGSHNLISAAPGFVRDPSPGSDGDWGTDDDEQADVHLTERSAAVDAGDPQLAQDPSGAPLILDVHGDARIVGNSVDIGAIEFQEVVSLERETPSLIVTSDRDVIDVYDGETTIREAIFYAHQYGGAPTITFDTNLSGATVSLAGDELCVYHPMAIDASMLSDLTISAGGLSRVFYNISDLSIDGLTMTQGKADSGGGVYNGGSLVLSNATISDSEVEGFDQVGGGGGVFNEPLATLRITNSTLSNNKGFGYKAVGGGGVLSRGTLTVIDSVVAGNETASESTGGGGIASIEGSLSIIGCTFLDNSAYGVGGGGLYNLNESATVEDSIFSGNNAESDEITVRGGGILNDGSGMTVSKTTFRENAANQGGGVYNASTMRVVDSIFEDNQSGNETFGGGIYNNDLLEVLGAIMRNNSAGVGGAFYNTDHAKAIIRRSLIQGNSAAADAGGVFNDGDLVVINSAFSGNVSRGTMGRGGGIYNTDRLTITNSTVSGNAVAGMGGTGAGVCNLGNLTINNSIVSQNSPSDAMSSFNPDSGEDWAGVVISSNNLMGVDPGFIRAPSPGVDGVWGTNDDDWGDLRLDGESAAINAGDNALAVDVEGEALAIGLDGQPRVADSVVDIGAYERQESASANREAASLVVTTAVDIFNLYDGQISLREAIFYAEPSAGLDTITFDTELDGATIELAGQELLVTSPVTIDASSLTSLIIDAGGHTRTIFSLSDLSLVGLTITGGSAYQGGGIYAPARLSLTDSVVRDNLATRRGGGVLASGDSELVITRSIVANNSAQDGAGVFAADLLLISDSDITENYATGDECFGGGVYATGYTTISNSRIQRQRLFGESCGGAGIYQRRGVLILVNSVVSENTITGDGASGGGVRSWKGNYLRILNSTIANNSLEGFRARGGGFYISESVLELANMTVAGNSVEGFEAQGAGIFSGSSEASVFNATIVGNRSSGDGALAGGIRVEKYLQSPSFQLMNSIVAANQGGTQPDISDPYDLASGSHNLIGDGTGQTALADGMDGNWVGTPAMPVDPGLSDWTQFDNGLWGYELRPESLAVNAGDNSLLPHDSYDLDGDDDKSEFLPLDIAGQPRVIGGIVNMGARETHLPPNAQSDQYTVQENVALEITADKGILSNDLNIDGYPLQAILVTAPLYGQLALGDDGAFAYTPDENFNREDSFQYKVSDGLDESNVVTVTITVTTDFQWHNGITPVNVNGDSTVTPYDALLIINELNRNGIHSRFSIIGTSRQAGRFR